MLSAAKPLRIAAGVLFPRRICTAPVRLYAPLGQGQALHRAENAILEIGVGLRKLPDQQLDLLALGVFVGRADIMHDRQPLLLCEAAHHALRQIEQRADLRHPRAVEVGHGLEAAQPSLEQQAHQERLYRVIVVMPERDLGKALIRQRLVQRAPAHFGAHGAGVFLLAVVKDDRPDLRFDDPERHLQFLAQRADRGKVHPLQPHVDRDRRQLIGLRIVLAHGGEQVQ